ncbi:MAG: hypothetical protein ACRDYA_12655 [Egibacteraceae bacterium]
MRPLFFSIDRTPSGYSGETSAAIPSNINTPSDDFGEASLDKAGLSPALPVSEDSEPDSAALLDLCLREYAELRADEREAVSSSGTLLTLAVTALGALVSALLASAELNPNALYLAVPILAISLAAFAASQTIASTMRSYYLRRLEIFINKAYGRPRVPVDESTANQVFLRIPSFAHIGSIINSPRSELWEFRVVPLLVLLPLVLLIIAVIVMSLAKLESIALRWFGIFFYIATGLPLLAAVISGIVSPRPAWLRINRAAEHRFRGRRAPARGVPLRYLLIPRRVELVVKGFTFVPLAILIGAALRPLAQPRPLFPTVLLVVFAFEFLIYQARYMWNDLRDIREDADHPAMTERHRLPANLDAISAILAIIFDLLRLLLGLIVAWRYLPRYDSAIFAATALTFAVAIAYESAKRWNKWTVSRKNNKMSLTLAAGFVYGLVGAGYAIRVALGLWIGSDGQLSTATAGYWVTIVELWLCGMMFILMTWVIDSCGFLEEGPRGVAEAARVKPHYLPLMRAANLLDHEGRPLIQPESALRHRPFKTNNLAQPWGYLLLISTALGAVAGWLLLGIPLRQAFWMYGVAAMLLSIILAAGRLKFWLGLVLSLVVAGLGWSLVWNGEVNATAALAAGAPVLVAQLNYISFVYLSEEARREFERRIERLMGDIRRFVQWLGKTIFRIAFGTAAEIILRHGKDHEK